MTENERELKCYEASIRMYSLRVHHWIGMHLSNSPDLKQGETMKRAKIFLDPAAEATEEYKSLVWKGEEG